MVKALLDNLTDVLELAAKAELCVRDFYRACASQWEKDKEFWLSLAAEEDGHYETVLQMVSMVKAHPERYTMLHLFNPETYRTFVDWVSSNTLAVQSSTMEKSDAVLAAKIIEHTILESRIQELVNTEDKEYLALLGLIIDQTKIHAGLVEDRAGALGK